MTTWHIITGEYPPAPGGVSDYSQAIAAGLAAAGDAVHVWCPAMDAEPTAVPGVTVHAIAGAWERSNLDRIDRELAELPGERKLLVQWVPHAYGRRSLNVSFCRWISRRARSGDHLELMIHEPGLGFREGSLKHDLAAGVHRVMLALLLRHARRVWVAIPAWTDVLRSWALGSKASYAWLPVPTTIPVAEVNGDVRRLKADLLPRPDGVIVGHFSTYSPEIRDALMEVLPQLLANTPNVQVQLLGRGGPELKRELRARIGENAQRILAPGELSETSLSCHLQVCDVMLQPYPDGASTRRTTLMAALAHGVAVVTTVGRLSEAFWRESDAVETVPAGDFPSMARAVSQLVDAPERRRRLAASARATYEARFSMPRVIEALRSGVGGAG